MHFADRLYCDVLVIGAGLAGLSAALTAAEAGKNVIVLSKGPRCSDGVIGFNAAAGEGDSVELYYNDIIASGQGLSNPGLARLLAEEAGNALRYLKSKGLRPDIRPDGSYDLLQPLGCSVPRLVHCGTRTGAETERLFLAELDRLCVRRFERAFALDLLSDGARVYGALVLLEGELCEIFSPSVIMAAGGCGGLYPVTVYPRAICGDSYGISARAGAEMTDMEFMQFEPCCLTMPESLRGKGISTTLMNAGAKLLNADGLEFLHRYFPDVSKIQKGELARAISAESACCGGRACIYDLTAVPEDEIRAHCLFYTQLCACGMNPKTTPLPVMPAAHTFLGGVKVNERLESSLVGLYAAGESLGGLHGANRIGGCAGAEIVSLGPIAGAYAAGRAPLTPTDRQRAEDIAADLTAAWTQGEPADMHALEESLSELKTLAAEKLYLIRNAEGISAASRELERLCEAWLPRSASDEKTLTALAGLKNMLLTARMIADASGRRKESRGVFFRSDYPEKDKAYEKNTVLRYFL